VRAGTAGPTPRRSVKEMKRLFDFVEYCFEADPKLHTIGWT